MSVEFTLDIYKNEINSIHPAVLDILLKDRTTQKNIIWASVDYTLHGTDYASGDEIKAALITNNRSNIIQPRVLKAQSQREGRTREKADCPCRFFPGRGHVLPAFGGVFWG